MLESAEKLIRDKKLIPPGAGVLCALSGGADSVCLLHLLYRLRGKYGFSLAAAHYNHNLRGEESDRDARFAAQFVSLCCGEERLPDGRVLPAVPLFTGAGDVAGEAERRGAGIEETAREMRYAFLRQAAGQAGVAYIATAHTADDNAETILFHLARGSGLRGLGGIPLARGGIIRPLLATTRREVEDYLTYYALPHVEDSSNWEDSCARNRIRHRITPELEELFPGFAARMADAAARLREDEALLDRLAGETLGEVEEGPEGLSLPAERIAGLPGPLAVRAARRLLGRMNGGEDNCSAPHLEGLLRLCRSPDPSARLALPGGLTARREYDRLVLARERAPAPMEARPLPMPGSCPAGKWLVICEAAVRGGEPQGPWEFWLDRGAVSSLTVRPRRTGDRLKLAGRPAKTVKKWCIERKIPAHLRDGLPVLALDGRPAAVAGLGADESLLAEEGGAAWHIRVLPAEGEKSPASHRET